MCLCVVNEGITQIDHIILVCVYLMRGEYDGRLMWPFTGCVTIQLVNQIRDQDHMQVTVKFNDKSTYISSCSRVTSGERAKIGCDKEFFSLLHSKGGNTLYIKDDCVKFRVTKVVVASCIECAVCRSENV